MAAHQVAIAKASFAACLLRPDPTSVGREEIGRFHAYLDDALLRCSPFNVQKCKTWLATSVVPSQGRITALAKYLAALSASFTEDGSGNQESKAAEPLISVPRKRLHILFVLNDLLHHTKHHSNDASKHTSLASKIQPFLVSLFESAASFEQAKKPKHHKRLLNLLNIWEAQSYQSQQFIEKLRQSVQNAGKVDTEAQEAKLDVLGGTSVDKRQSQRSKQIPFVMPSSHGDVNTPYYDLPAGNLMPHIVPNSSAPIRPQLVKPLQFMAGPADENLAMIVQDFLKDVGSIYSNHDYMDDEGLITDIDEMGQIMVEDEASGELVASEGYYGWSIAFCEKMRMKKKGIQPNTNNGERGRSRSRSSSQSSGPRKRRRYSSSRGSYDSRGRTRSPSPDYERGRRKSSSRPVSASGKSTRFRLPSGRSRSRSRSQSRPNRQSQPGQPDPRPRRGQSSPRPQAPNQLQAPQHVRTHFLPPQPNAPFVTPVDQISDPFLLPTLPHAPSAPTNQRHNYPLGPKGLPIPPPPPFHQGPWPPPPPNMPQGLHFQSGQYPNYSTVSPQGQGHSPFMPPPPPVQAGGDRLAGREQGQGQGQTQASWHYQAPPPPQQQQQQQSWQFRPPSQPQGVFGAQGVPPPPPPPPLGQAWQEQPNVRGNASAYGRGQGQGGRGRGGWQAGRGGGGQSASGRN